jgi:HAMP domain-containing protein
MKLLVKFNLIFLVVFGAGLALASFLVNQSLKADAKREVVDQARLMMETTLSTRNYTTKQIKPLLDPVLALSNKFIPQTVPAYSATEVFNYLHQRYPDYYYKEATLNPTNPRDRTVDWEADVVNDFRNHPDKTEFIGERDTPSGPCLFLARPLKITNPACLECHSTEEKAPFSQIKSYPSGTGFGWHLNETIGAQIVSVPMAVPLRVAESGLKRFLLYLGTLALLTLGVLDAVLFLTVIRPVSRLSEMADEISKGNMDVAELPVKGKDEVSVLASSFNRMHRSLKRAMSMLEGNDS